MKKRENNEQDVSLRPLLIFAAATFAICCVCAVIVFLSLDSWEKRGQFGDMFGGVNAMFSGLAFAGVVYAILLQRRELALQREELRLSREELTAQNEIITAQLATMQDSLQFERNKEDIASQPRFRSNGGSRIPNNRTIEYINLGARITDISTSLLEPASGLSLSIEPTDVWDTTNPAKLKIVGFGGNPCPDCVFQIHFTDKLGRKQTLQFQLPGDSNILKQLP